MNVQHHIGGHSLFHAVKTVSEAPIKEHTCV